MYMIPRVDRGEGEYQTTHMVVVNAVRKVLRLSRENLLCMRSSSAVFLCVTNISCCARSLCVMNYYAGSSMLLRD